MKYQILTHPHAATLAEMVNAEIDKGWQVSGSLQMSATPVQQQGIAGQQIGYATLYAQAMVRKVTLFELGSKNQ